MPHVAGHVDRQLHREDAREGQVEGVQLTDVNYYYYYYYYYIIIIYHHFIIIAREGQIEGIQLATNGNDHHQK